LFSSEAPSLVCSAAFVLCPHKVFPLCTQSPGAFLCVRISSSYKDISLTR
jgi:hypothetical protein